MFLKRWICTLVILMEPSVSVILSVVEVAIQDGAAEDRISDYVVPVLVLSNGT